MSLIEGIGDEVMVLAAFLVLATTVIIAWLSTHVGDRPRPQQVVIQTTITTVHGRQQQTSANASEEPSRDQSEVRDGGGSGGGGSIDAHTSASSGTGNQERSSERTSANDSIDQPDQNTVANDSVLGAQSDVHQRTSESVSASQTNDEVDSSIADSGDKSDNASSEGRTNVEELGQSQNIGESSSIEDNSTSVEDQRSSESLNQNVLRNRQTSQVYPTLPSYSTESASGGTSTAASMTTAVSFGGQAAEEASGVEDVGGSEEPREGGICIRVKFSNDQERLVQTFPEETLGQFRRQNFVEELEAGKLVRFIANGQFLADDSQTLTSLNLSNNSVLHCHVTQGEPIRQGQHQAQDGDLDLGHFMVPLFGCILAFVWYLRWQYRYMFNATSTLSLIGVTVLFFLAVLAAWRG